MLSEKSKGIRFQTVNEQFQIVLYNKWLLKVLKSNEHVMLLFYQFIVIFTCELMLSDRVISILSE